MPQRIRPTSVAVAALLGILATACHRSQAPSSATATAPLPATADSLALLDRAGSGGTDSLHGDRMPVIVAGGRLADSIAAAPLSLSLAEIGYRDGVVLAGTNADVTVAIPVDPGLRADALHLAVVPTPLMPAATLTLKQRDRVLALRAVTDTTTTLTLPLADAAVVDGKATIELSLAIPGRDRCEAALFYRTVLLPASTVSYLGRPAATTAINGFFPAWLDHVTFYLADHPSLDAAQAALDASAFVARRYRGMSTHFVIAPLPPPGTPLPEATPYARALIWSPAGATGIVAVDSGRGTVLALAARRDARQIFTLAQGADVVAAPGLSQTSVDLRHNTPPATAVRTLADLGFDHRTIEGTSLVATSYQIALADFGTRNPPSALRLIVHHSVLPPNGNGSLRLLLNGSLIYSTALEHDGLDVVIAIPSTALRRDNTFDVRFQVTLGEGQCLIGGPLFTATIDNGSAFVLRGDNALAPGFDRFPQAFVPAFSVLLDPVDRFRVDLAAAVVGAMQQTTTTPLAPALARDRASATGPLLAVGTTPLAEALDAPVVSAGFRLRDRDGRVWDEFTPSASYGAMQAWERDGNDVLLLDHTGADGAPLDGLVHDVLAPYGWFGVRGDLAVRSVAGPTRVLQLANAGWHLEPVPEPEGSVFLRYRTLIFIVAAVIVILLLIWFAPRVVRRDLDTTG